MLLCLLILTAATLVCGFAPNFEVLVAARMVGGLAAGGVVPIAFALVGDRDSGGGTAGGHGPSAVRDHDR